MFLKILKSLYTYIDKNFTLISTSMRISLTTKVIHTCNAALQADELSDLKPLRIEKKGKDPLRTGSCSAYALAVACDAAVWTTWADSMAWDNVGGMALYQGLHLEDRWT